jgi:hypothetical protein
MLLWELHFIQKRKSSANQLRNHEFIYSGAKISSQTTGWLPTVQPSCPGGIEPTSPGPNASSFPASFASLEATVTLVKEIIKARMTENETKAKK